MIKDIIYDPANECMSRDELISIQNERLVKTVKHEYDNVPLYRQRMDEKGIKPEDIKSVEDLKYLPFTQKTWSFLVDLESEGLELQPLML